MNNPMNSSSTYLILVLLAALGQACQHKANTIKPGELWLDNHGVAINAHGGGFLYDDGTYYWYGEHKIVGPSGNRAQVGVHVYSSRDLYHWKDEGIALQVIANDSTHEITKGCILERPKVIYNQLSDTYVMWFHLELKGEGYGSARTALATSKSPTGPFDYLRSYRPHARQWPINFPDSLKSTDTERKAPYEAAQSELDQEIKGKYLLGPVEG